MSAFSGGGGEDGGGGEVGGGGGEGGSLGGEGGGGEEAMAVDGEVVEEANGGGRWCAHTPCCPKHPLWCSGGVWPHNLHAIGGVKKHRCLSRRNHRQ